ncbi:MAG: 3'(2'),5'-bisphosphate nucleotidase CysQ [Ruminococcaceae bacterium]|nr:3'(2'),5'-bisphosphate nucleotidase CysQ [Oscillospiraceae bacterium]
MYIEILSHMVSAAISASNKICEIYNGQFSITEKEDNSPLTTADIESNRIITTHLRSRFPEYAILTEEEHDDLSRLTNPFGVFIVDPLDGTKEFIKKNGEFCVSVALAVKNKIVCGVVAVPVQKVLYYAIEGHGAYKCNFDAVSCGFTFGVGKCLSVSSRRDKVIVALSRSHGDEKTEKMLERNAVRILETVTVGSCLKGCMIAEGKADVHYRFGPGTKEWDTAGMQIICEEAGAVFTDIYGAPLKANRDDPRNLDGFIILNHPISALDIDGLVTQ